MVLYGVACMRSITAIHTYPVGILYSRVTFKVIGFPAESSEPNSVCLWPSASLKPEFSCSKRWGWLLVVPPGLLTAALLFFLNYVLLYLKPLSVFDLTILWSALIRVSSSLYSWAYRGSQFSSSPLGASESTSTSLIHIFHLSPWISPMSIFIQLCT